MPYHTDKATAAAMKRRTDKSVEKVKPKKKKAMKIFDKLPPNSHKMPSGIIMSGKTHSANSKPIGKLRVSKNPKAMKGSKEMKEKMAKLRAMRKKK